MGSTYWLDDVEFPVGRLGIVKQRVVGSIIGCGVEVSLDANIDANVDATAHAHASVDSSSSLLVSSLLFAFYVNYNIDG
ncbi:uncharacterized protein EAE97_011626 [Botrytis byssoidea]|uniref:Uncharacterized protein n=1 Tax=Botrytis byssoidea TaxID=139641 RepID=A0A9P5LH05_9HELO|nr:uncharacterized protein EAE97_011626 [Botrytis byssoidea]KAF7919708.1 hypothetical protein EAE97_011626 [Botrytis byssoidea]